MSPEWVMLFTSSDMSEEMFHVGHRSPVTFAFWLNSSVDLADKQPRYRRKIPCCQAVWSCLAVRNYVYLRNKWPCHHLGSKNMFFASFLTCKTSLLSQPSRTIADVWWPYMVVQGSLHSGRLLFQSWSHSWGRDRRLFEWVWDGRPIGRNIIPLWMRVCPTNSANRSQFIAHTDHWAL